MHNLLRKLFVLPLALSVLSLHAQAPAASTSAPASASSTQDPSQAIVSLNKQLDGIKTTLSSKPADAPLTELRSESLGVQQQAGQWVETLTPQMDSLQARLTVLGPPPAAGAPPETPAVSQQRRQLERDKSKLDSEIKQAQLLNQDAAKLTTQIVDARNRAIPDTAQHALRLAAHHRFLVESRKILPG